MTPTGASGIAFVEPQPTSQPLGERLVAQGRLSRRDLERALAAQQEMGDLLGRVLIKLGLLSELDVASVLAEQLAVPLVPATDFPASALTLDNVNLDFLQDHQVLPWKREDERLFLVMGVPQDDYVRKALHLATGCEIVPALGLESDIEAALQRLYIEPELEALDEEAALAAGDNEFIEHLRDLASEAPVIRLVNQLIARAIDLRASDIHIEPFEGTLQLRYRVDGVLQAAEAPPVHLSAAVTSRLKLLAHLNIAERRLPQDGRIKTRVKGHEIDLRVSTVPTVHGESLVMRVLDRESMHYRLEDMGFSPDTLEHYQELLARPHGILLVTGPTGSGKTTTLYASLAKIDATELKIVTVEDPVEYQLDGINQIQVQANIGLSFANALRSILRQDPDIIMIGEMRDTETAQIAVQSALTGHLVLSTLHTNTAAGAITRLEDMGVERYLITSSVNGVLSQRLIRRLCPHCREAVAIPEGVRERSGLARFLAAGQDQIHQARGCAHCKQTGYLGRMAVHELLVLDDEVHRAILDGADANALHGLARRRGMRTLYEDGLRKVAAGDSSLEEVLRVTQDQGDA